MSESFLVAIRCPRCGAETDFPEGTHALRCAYCGVTLRILGAHRGGRARFVMPPTLEAERLAPLLLAYAAERGRRLDSVEWRTLVAAPFWHARGVALAYRFTSPARPLASLPRPVPVTPSSAGGAPSAAPRELREPAGAASSLAGLPATLLRKGIDLLLRWTVADATGADTLLDQLAGRDGHLGVEGGEAAPARAFAHDERRFDARHVDLSFPAFAGADLGLVSLGVRPGARPLRVLAPDTLPPGALMLPLEVDAEAALRRVAALAAGQFSEMPGEVIIERTATVTASLSVIYFPFWTASAILDGVERLVVVDAVAGSVVREGEPSEPWFAGLAARTPPPLAPGSLGFLPLTCPECAAPLPLETRAVVHLCTHCGRAWAEGDDRLVRIEYEAVAARGAAVYLPAWRFQAAITVEGKRLTRAAELPRLFKPAGWPLPPAPDATDADRAAALFVPAFECRALTVVERLAAALARLQPRVDRTDAGGDPPLPLAPTPRAVGASLNEADAAALARLFTIGLVPGAGPAARRRIASLSVELGPGRLVWLPVHDRGPYLQDRLTAVSVPKASLGWPADDVRAPGRRKQTPSRRSGAAGGRTW